MYMSHTLAKSLPKVYRNSIMHMTIKMVDVFTLILYFSRYLWPYDGTLYLQIVMLLTLNVSVPFLLDSRVRRKSSNSLFFRVGPIGNRCTSCRKESTISSPNFVLHCLRQPHGSVRSAAIFSPSSAVSFLVRLSSKIERPIYRNLVKIKTSEQLNVLMA